MENASEGPSFFSIDAENFDPRNDGFLFSPHTSSLEPFSRSDPSLFLSALLSR